jgi:hypothetical protein
MDLRGDDGQRLSHRSLPDFRRPDGTIVLHMARLRTKRFLMYIVLVVPAYALWVAFFGDRPKNRVTIVAVAFAFSTFWLLLTRALNRRAVLIDGARVGWVNGWSPKLTYWADLNDLDSISTIVGPRDVKWWPGDLVAPRKTVIVWSKTGGMPARWVSKRFRHSNRDLHNEMRAKLAGGLHPFYVDLFDLGSERAAVFESVLDRYRSN